ncbi:holin [Brevibacillus reuszeri]|nr:holin [Brevibacillus reuszeri]
MADKALIVVVVLLVIGYFLKRTPRIQDWMIPWFLTVAGVALACGILQAVSVESVVQGILAAGIASLTHQLWKQTAEKRKVDAE